MFQSNYQRSGFSSLQLHPQNDIKRALSTMGITKQFLERREMAANYAAPPAILLERHMFWNRINFGVKGTQLSEMIDWGEVFLCV